MQETRVWFLVWEDPTCHGATKPAHHNYWAHVSQLLRLAYPRARALQQEKPLQGEACAPHLESSFCPVQLEKAPAQQRKPSATKINKKIFLKDTFFFLKRHLVYKSINQPMHTCMHKWMSSFQVKTTGEIGDELFQPLYTLSMHSKMHYNFKSDYHDISKGKIK